MDILSLLLGAALTILGGYLSNRQTSKLSRAAEIRKIRTEKLELLASLAVSAPDWVERMEEDTFAFSPRHTPSEPMEQMYVLSDLYFPEIGLQVHEFCSATRELCQCIRKEGSRRLGEGTATGQVMVEYLAIQKQMLQKYSEERLAINKKVIEKQDVLIKALRTVVEKLDA